MRTLLITCKEAPLKTRATAADSKLRPRSNDDILLALGSQRCRAHDAFALYDVKKYALGDVSGTRAGLLRRLPPPSMILQYSALLGLP
jgi:hypothetical protein